MDVTGATGGAYGAGMAGGVFDPVGLMKQPQTIMRVVNWVFSVIVFGCISNEGYVSTNSSPDLYCVFNRNGNACRFGIAIGAIAFLASSALLLLDLYFPQISSVKDRRKVVIFDMAFSAAWSFLWFVCFCFLTNQWQKTSADVAPSYSHDSARAAITFSFFSIISWAASIFFAFKRYKLGVDSTLSEGYVDPALAEGQGGGGGGAAFGSEAPQPGTGGDFYQRSPSFPDGHGIDQTADGYQTQY
ncbi:synaptogyrin-3-like [Petromyzon marinus]|uniref:synaptogyrin-3-like n=1 Tax=Petromyzon marinus TaxID=7757 RepID=UPI003F707E80